MTASLAKEVLLRYRPGTEDDRDPEVMSALELAREDAELKAWLVGHLTFQAVVRTQLRQLEVPLGLKASLLAGKPAGRSRSVASTEVVALWAWWRRPRYAFAVAAAVVVCVGLLVFLWPGRATDRWANFQDRMVGMALRNYGMEFRTPDPEALRSLIASGGGPSNYAIPAGLQKRSLTGGGVLRWRNHPVSMVCFDRGDSQMLYLFVIAEGAAADSAPAERLVQNRDDMKTVRWRQGGYLYMLMGPDEPEFIEKYL